MIVFLHLSELIYKKMFEGWTLQWCGCKSFLTLQWVLFSPGRVWDAAKRTPLSGLLTGSGPFPGPEPGWYRRGGGGRWVFFYTNKNTLLTHHQTETDPPNKKLQSSVSTEFQHTDPVLQEAPRSADVCVFSPQASSWIMQWTGRTCLSGGARVPAHLLQSKWS